MEQVSQLELLFTLMSNGWRPALPQSRHLEPYLSGATKVFYLRKVANNWSVSQAYMLALAKSMPRLKLIEGKRWSSTA